MSDARWNDPREYDARDLGVEMPRVTDREIEDIRRHAETMACIMVEMCQEQCLASE